MFPVVYKISGKEILFAGGDQVHERIASELLTEDPIVTVIAPSVTDNLRTFSRFGRVNIMERWAEASDIERKYKLAFINTGDPELDEELADAAGNAGIPVYCHRNEKLSDFEIPRVLRDRKNGMMLSVCPSVHGDIDPDAFLERVGEFVKDMELEES